MEYLLKASGIVTILIACYYLLLQKETFFKSIRIYFLVGLGLAISLPLIEIPVYVEFVSQQINNGSLPKIINGEISVLLLSNLIQFVPYIYLSGVLLFSIIFFVQLLSLLFLLRKHSISKQGNIYIVETTKNISPFSFFNIIVYNKTKFSPEELEHIITHEKVHAIQWHSIDTLLTYTLAILLWFNPFVWLLKKAVDQNLEFLADSDAFDKVNCQKSFQLTMLKTSQVSFCDGITSNFYNKLTKKRIQFLNSKQSTPNKQWKYLILLPLLTAFIYTFNTKTIAQVDAAKGQVDKKLLQNNEASRNNRDSEFSKNGVDEHDNNESHVEESEHKDEHGLVNEHSEKLKEKGHRENSEDNDNHDGNN